MTFLSIEEETVLNMPEIPEEFDVFHLPHEHMIKIKKDIDTEVRPLYTHTIKPVLLITTVKMYYIPH